MSTANPITSTVRDMSVQPVSSVSALNNVCRFDLVTTGSEGWEFKGQASVDTFLFNFSPYNSNFALNSDQRTYTTGSGMSFNLHPAMTAVHETDLHQPGDCLIIEFPNGLFGNDLEQDFGVGSLDRSHMNISDRKVGLFANELRTALYSLQNRKFQNTIFIEGLSLTLRAAIAESVLPDPKASKISKKLEKHHIAKIQDLIEVSLDSDLTLDRISKEIGFSPFWVSRGFKETMGCGIHQYLLSRRIDRVRWLLLETSMPLIEIAYATGFSS